jgi:arylsulfatase A-like enzyme
MRWLEDNYRAGPFFLWVDFFDPHEPWDPPEYLVRRYDPDYQGTPMIHPNYGLASDYTEEELQNLWAHYAAEAELVDRWIGRVLQKIDDLALWDESVVMVLSDHGMSLGEHGRTGKSNISDERDPRFWPNYPEVSHQLCLFAGGSIPRGESRDIIVQPCDLAPTFCELAGVEIAPTKPYEGRSFAGSLLSGDKPHRDYAVTGCHINAQGAAVPRRASTPFLITPRWGYAPVGAGGRPELYALDQDPLAAVDVAADHPKEVAELHELFLSDLRSHDPEDFFLRLWDRPGGGEGTWAVDYG